MRHGYVPERGDIAWLHFDPQAGHEQAGRRPALVLSPRSYNVRTGLCIVCPVTSRKKGYSFEAALPSELPVSGVVLSDHVKSLDWHARNASFACKANPELQEEVLGKLSAILFDE